MERGGCTHQDHVMREGQSSSCRTYTQRKEGFGPPLDLPPLHRISPAKSKVQAMLHIMMNGRPVEFCHEINAFFIDFSVLKKGVNGHSQHHTN